MDEKRIELELSKIVLSTYNKIALWNNNDYDSTKQKSDALKIVSQDIVQSTLEELLIGLNIKTNTVISRGEDIVGDTQITKDLESFKNVNEADILSKLFNKK